MSIFNTTIFRSIADLAIGAKKRRDKEHQDFLAAYREIVETIPVEVVELFGTMGDVKLVKGTNNTTAGLQLNAADFMWWKGKIEIEGWSFAKGAAGVWIDMLDRISKIAQMDRLEPDERKALIALMESGFNK